MNDRHDKSLRHFRDAALAAMEVLQSRYGMSLWIATSGDDDSVVLQVRDSGFDQTDVNVRSALQHYCRIAAVLGPKVEPSVDEASTLAGTDTQRRLRVGAFIGLPLRLDDGTVVGTLCAIDPERQPDSLREGQPEFENVARMLATLLAVETRHDSLQRRVKRAEARLVDAVTGLYSEQGWRRLVEAEEERCERYGRPAGAIVIRLDRGEVQTAGELIVDRTRGTDVAARIAEDKMGVLVLETEPNALPRVVDRLDRELTARGISAAFGYAMRDAKTGLAGSLQAAEPAAVH